MPTYITAADVVLFTGSGQTTAVLEALIDGAEGWLSGQLAALNVTGNTGNGVLQQSVMEYTIALLYNRDQMDGTRPGSQSLDGTLTMTSNIPAAIKEHKDAAMSLVEDYAREQQGDPWGESAANSEDTVVRADHEMPTYNLDQTKIKQYHDRAGESGSQDGTEVS